MPTVTYVINFLMYIYNVYIYIMYVYIYIYTQWYILVTFPGLIRKMENLSGINILTFFFQI